MMTFSSAADGSALKSVRFGSAVYGDRSAKVRGPSSLHISAGEQEISQDSEHFRDRVSFQKNLPAPEV